MSETISVLWPSSALTPEQWRRRVTDLAELAEQMIGKKVTLQRQAQLALWWCGLCWSGFGAETIAASCRASLLLNQNVVMAADASAQLDEVAERLDHIWELSQSDPSAAVATLPPPMLDLPPGAGRSGRPPRPAVEHHDVEQVEPEPVEQVEPEPVAEVLEPVEQVEPEHHDVVHLEPVEHQDVEQVEPDTAPPAPAVPSGWFTAGDVAQLVGISETTLSRWRKSGRCGEQKVDWLKCGRQFFFNPETAEQLLEQQQQRATARVELLAEPLTDPEQWLTTDELAELVGMSTAWIALVRRLQVLIEGVHYFKIQPGELPSRQCRGFRHHRELCLAALAKHRGQKSPRGRDSQGH